jgi:hypothetical protein
VPPAAEPLTAGAIWREMLETLRPNFAVLFAVTAPFTLLVGMALSLFGPPMPKTIEGFTPQTVLILGVLPNVIGVIAQLAVARLVLRPGETAGRALGTALASLPAWAGAALLTGIPIAAAGGLLLLLVPAGVALLILMLPALYVTARLFLIAPLVVVDRVGPVAAVRRSWDVTARIAWQLVLLFVVAGIGLALAGALAGGLGGAIGSVLLLMGSKGAADFAAALVPALLSTVVAMGSAVASAVVYRRVAG